MFGETSGKYDFKNSQVTDSSLNVGLAKRDGKENFEADQEISVGGFVGKAQGNSTVHGINSNTYLTDVTITIGEAATTYAGLLFGRVGTLITNDDDNPSFKGTIQNDEVTEKGQKTKKPTTLVIGGAAGSADNATIFGMSANLTVDDLATKTYQVKENGQITETRISSVGSVFGYVGKAEIGEGNNEIRYYKNITIAGSDSASTSKEEYNAIAIGGLIGRATGKLTLSNSGYYGDLTIRYIATTRYIGGLVGRVEGELKLDEVAFGESKDGSTTGSIKIERVDGKDNGDNKPCDSSTTYVGGLVGFANEKATIKNASVMGDILFPSDYNKEGETTGTPIAIGEKSTVNVGLVAGVLTNKGENEIKNARVGGDIFFGNATIQGTINAGALVGTFNGGTISGSYAWGNVELKNAKLLNGGKFEIDVLTVGGLVGNVGGATTLSDNYSLTSMYITRLASLKDTKINALVGTKSSSVEATKDKDGKETNFYCHQINLATDTIGQNLYYKNGIVAGNDPILKKLDGFIKGLKAEKGSKLNPSPYSGGETEEGKYYYLYSSYSNPSTPPSTPTENGFAGHLVGDGNNFVSSTTPFDEISKNGYISGIRFVVTSKTEGTNAGRVNSSGNNTTLPSGVAYENKGIIFAVNVYAKGFKDLNSSFGNVLYSFNAGIAGTNTGLISDCGVVLNVKSLFAGISSNNTGVVANSYATGAVHEKAQYALTAGSNAGTIRNSYSAIDAKINVAQNNKLENVYYDETTIHTESTKVGIEKSTDELSTVNTSSTDILNNLKGNNNWKQDFRYNFGYPYLGDKAYSGFSYMEEYTGGLIPDEENKGLRDEFNKKYKDVTKRLFLTYDGKTASWKGIIDPYNYNMKRFTIESDGFSCSKYIWIGTQTGKYTGNVSYVYCYTDNGNFIPDRYTDLISGNTFTIKSVVEKEVPGLKCIATWELTYNIANVLDEQTFGGSKKPKIDFVNTSSPVQIPNAGKLAQLQGKTGENSNAHNKSLWGKKYILLSNIDLSAFFDNIKEEKNKKWDSIGRQEGYGYTGTFDGNNYKIYNIPEFNNTTSRVGFFGYLSGGTIKNCGFIYKDGTTLKSTQDVGGVVGRIENGSVNNVSSSGATVSNNGNDNNSYGGLVGSIRNGTISNSSNYNTVSATNNAGGIVGYANGDNSITGCNNFGVIKDASRSAGIVGQLVSGSVSNCSNYSSITATNSVSGIANYSQWGDAKKGQGKSGEIHRKGNPSGQSYTVGYVEWVVTEWDEYGDNIKYSLYYRGQFIYKGVYKKSLLGETTIKVTSFIIPSLTGSITLGIEYYKIYGPIVGVIIDQSVQVNINYNIQEKIGNSGLFSSCHDFAYEELKKLENLDDGVVYYTTKTGELIWMTRQDGFSIYSADNKVTIPYEVGETTSCFGLTMILPGDNICRIYNSDPEGSQSLWSNSTSKVTPTDGVYNIYTAEDFAWVAQQIKAGKMTGETINICNDIDLTGKVWDPIKNYKKDFKIAGLNILVNDNNHESRVLHYKGIEITISYIEEIDAKKHLLGIKVGKNKICEFVYSPGPGKTYFSETFDNVKYHLVSDTYSGGITMLIIQPIYNNEFYFNGYKIFGLSKGAYDYNTTNPIFTKDSDYVPSENVTVYSHAES